MRTEQKGRPTGKDQCTKAKQQSFTVMAERSTPKCFCPILKSNYEIKEVSPARPELTPESPEAVLDSSPSVIQNDLCDVGLQRKEFKSMYSVDLAE